MFYKGLLHTQRYLVELKVLFDGQVFVLTYGHVGQIFSAGHTGHTVIVQVGHA